MSTFSIVVTAYNNAEYLEGCLSSLLKQSYTDWQCVVVNDASPDETSRIAHDFAERDPRFVVLDLETNRGLHLARKRGVEACEGDYVIFLDADDEFAPTGLEELAAKAETTDKEIIHFGATVISGGVDEESCKAFEDNINSQLDEVDTAGLMHAVFSKQGGFVRDWRATQRAYTHDLVTRAFERMTDKRLERAEDAYEVFVLAALSNGEASFDNVRLLDYYYGRGVTGTSAIDAKTFSGFVDQFSLCSDELLAFAKPRYETQAIETKEKLLDLLMNDWHVRVADADKAQAAHYAAEVFGNTAIAAQLMRLARDDAYSAWTNAALIDENTPLVQWFRLAQELASKDFGTGTDACEAPTHDAAIFELYGKYREEARGHISDLEHRSTWATGSEPSAPSLVMQTAYEAHDVRIFVTTHKDVDTFQSEILQPVQVGPLESRKRLLWAYQDDTGENIATLNPMYCELTTQYWAWKNAQADYYGFCHYRRYFDFSATEHEENPYGEIMDPAIGWGSQAEYCLDDDSITAAVEGYDIVTTGIKDLQDFPEAYESTFDHYKRAPYLKIKDLERVIEILKEQEPDYAEDADAYLAGSKTCFCNMYIMRKELFFAYCAWMFPLLERFCEGWDTELLSHETLRTPGHLSERLFNIWLLHQKRTNPELKHKELQCVHFEKPEHQVVKPLDAVVPAGAQASKPVVPVVFAADNNYVPMVTTTIYSMLKNASSEYFYDVVILEKDFSAHNKEVMSNFFAQFDNAALRFLNVGGIMSAYNLQTSNEHISVETYYRFLIQQVLPDYDKVLYLDSDLIIKGDAAELFNTELGDNLIAAARDIDYLGNLNMNDGERMDYTREVLGMENPYDYFQAGVLVLNTAAMRELHTVGEWLEIASEPKYIYDDQDILNAECEGRVAYLDNAWNVMNDCGGRIKKVFSFAPAAIYDKFLAAYAAPKIVHYAGFEKPWKPGPCDLADLYWSYARETPFYEALFVGKYADQYRVAEDITAAKDEVIYKLTVPPKAISEDSPLRDVFDGVLPQGSRRREVAKAAVRKIRGIK